MGINDNESFYRILFSRGTPISRKIPVHKLWRKKQPIANQITGFQDPVISADVTDGLFIFLVCRHISKRQTSSSSWFRHGCSKIWSIILPISWWEVGFKLSLNERLRHPFHLSLNNQRLASMNCCFFVILEHLRKFNSPPAIKEGNLRLWCSLHS